jgi:hypothetical protein
MDSAVFDAALIAAAQKVEHYEIATYGTPATWAEMPGLEEVSEATCSKNCRRKRRGGRQIDVAGRGNQRTREST